MRKLMHSRLWRGVGYVLDYFFLNILWILCCIPVFTIGAATTGAYYASLRLMNEDDDAVIQNFFKSFKSNFKQATLLWLPVLAVAAFLALDISLCFRYSQVTQTMIAVVFIMLVCIAFLLLLTVLYLFPLQSWFDNTLVVTLRNALVLGVHHFGWSIVLVISDALVILIALCVKGMILFAPGMLFAWNGFVFKRIFIQYTPQTSEGTQSNDL